MSVKKQFLIISFLAFGIAVINLIRCNNPEKKILPLTRRWEKAVPNQEIPVGLTSLSAKSCGTCHQQYYEEWKLSTHAHAWNDLQFQAELGKESSPFMCVNCHTPLQNQQPSIIEGLVDGDIYQPVKTNNPQFDQSLQQEGINCASCHIRNNQIIGPNGSTAAPHTVIKDPVFLSEQLCISCHNASAVITPVLACTFETGDEWEAGPYFGTKNCISCHMPSVTREIVAGFGEKPGHRHFFPGSGIPKFDTVETQMLNGLAFYPSLLKSTYREQDSIHFSLKVKNEFAGHKVPTGDPERFFEISFIVRDGAGTILATKTGRIGETWEWYPEAKKIADNNLLPNEERDFDFSYRPLEKEKLYFSVNVTKHRLNKESAEYNKLTAKYPLFITVFEKEYETEVR